MSKYPLQNCIHGSLGTGRLSRRSAEQTLETTAMMSSMINLHYQYLALRDILAVMHVRICCIRVFLSFLYVLCRVFILFMFIYHLFLVFYDKRSLLLHKLARAELTNLRVI